MLCHLKVDNVICHLKVDNVFISPPMMNLPSSIGLLALVVELLCSRFRMSWIRCASVSFGVRDGACTFTTSMPFSSVSPGIVHRKACAIRPVPCSVAADDVEADHGDDIVLICRNMNASTT